MCLIIHKPEQVIIPEEWIHSSFLHNKDGWGVMYYNNGAVQVEKGFKLSALISCIGRNMDKELAIHMRAATQGNINIENCHPVRVVEGIWLMHNGILGVPEKHQAWSDTKHFAEYAVKPILQAYPHLFGTAFLEGMLSYFIGTGNKLLLMNEKGKVMIVNRKSGEDKEGCWLSNLYSINVYEGMEWHKSNKNAYSFAWSGESAITSPATTSSYALPPSSRVFRYCEGCKCSIELEEYEWEKISAVGYVCPTCMKQLEDDLEYMEDISLEDLKRMTYGEIKEICRVSPESIAWILLNELM